MTEFKSDLDLKLRSSGLDPSSYSSRSQYEEHLLEQYKLFVEMADRISARRQSANAFFLSVNTALVGIVTYVGLAPEPGGSGGSRWLVALAGIVLSYMWYRLIRSYRDLNTGKFKVIHAIERLLPLSPYDAEWEAVGRGKNKKLYLPFTHIEVGVPWVFVALHSAVILRALMA